MKSDQVMGLHSHTTMAIKTSKEGSEVGLSVKADGGIAFIKSLISGDTQEGLAGKVGRFCT